MDLESIPGVGTKTAAALSALDEPERALETGDVLALASVPEISPGKAARIARAAIRQRHDERGELLATDRARTIYKELLKLLKERAATDYAAARVETFYPSTAESRIEEVRSFAADAMDRKWSAAVLETLDGVAPLESPPAVQVRDRCIATVDAKRYSDAREAFPELSVEVVEDARELAELARGYSTVIALDERFAGVEVDGDVRIDPTAIQQPETIVPERELAFFAHNRERLQAAIAVHHEADLDTAANLEALEAALDRLTLDGSIVGNDELDRLARAANEFDSTIEAGTELANERLRVAIRERDVTIEGADLLSLAEQGASVDSILDRELEESYTEAINAARDHLVESLDLKGDEADRARRAFPDEPTYPVEYDEAVGRHLREDLASARNRRRLELKRELVGRLDGMRAQAKAVVQTALEFDVELAIARFTHDFDATLPDLGGVGIDITGGRCPLLDESFDAIEPVDYHVEEVVLLSGVNSGGKTSTLDLIATVTILAQMGLPVPAEQVYLTPVDELHYFTKARGTLDAGAFEATLREFDELVAGPERKLVLVDELESITEPGASATIMAGLLEQLAEEEATAVFVTHMASEIQTEAAFDLGVDGIEALGLEGGGLLVDRSPVKDHLARSTPELIVEQLARESDTVFYRRLVGKFDDER